MREAISLATQAGQGRDVAILHNNLGIQLWVHSGPQAALDQLRKGIAYATTRGLAEIAAASTATTLDPLVDAGNLDESLAVAAALAEQLKDDRTTLAEVRCVQARILTLRGRAIETSDYLDWMETTARDEGSADTVVLGLGAAALARTALGDLDRAATLLTEITETPHTHDTTYYSAYLPAFVRSSLAIGRPDLAQALIADYDPRSLYAQHALTTANAALAEAGGRHQIAVDGYTDAGLRWGRFGVVPEHGFALLGRGRCLLQLGQPEQAATVVRQARECFSELGAMPALAETGTLLEQASEITS